MSEPAPRTPAEILSSAGVWPVPGLDAAGGDPGAWLQALARGSRLLEIGCGNGATAIRLAQAGRHVTGVDTRDELVADAARALADLPPAVGERVAFVTARGVGVPCESESFDTVVLSELTTDTGDLGLALDEVLRVVRPGGLLLMTAASSCETTMAGEGTELARLLATIEPRFVIEQVDLLDGYLGLVATARDAITATTPGEGWAAAGALRALRRQTERAMRVEAEVRGLRASHVKRGHFAADFEAERQRRRADALEHQRETLAAQLEQAVRAAELDRHTASQLERERGELEQRAISLKQQRAEVTRWLEEEQARTEELATQGRELRARLQHEEQRAHQLEVERQEITADRDRAQGELATVAGESRRLREMLAGRDRQIDGYEASRGYRILRRLWHLRHPMAGRRARRG